MDGSERELEIDDDPALEPKLELVRKIGWSIFTLILLAAMLGLLGSGPLSARRLGDASAYIELNRFEHAQAATRLVVGYAGPEFRSDTVRVVFERRYFEHMTIERITPEPLRSEVVPGGVAFVFARSGELPKGEIDFDVRATRAGSVRAQVTIGGAAPLAIRQFIFP